MVSLGNNELIVYIGTSVSDCTQYIPRLTHTVHDLLHRCQTAINFTHILQGCFTSTGAIKRLPQCQWSKPEEYGSHESFNLQRSQQNWYQYAHIFKCIFLIKIAFGNKVQYPQPHMLCCHSCLPLAVWYKTKFGSQNLATNFGNHL